MGRIVTIELLGDQKSLLAPAIAPLSAIIVNKARDNPDQTRKYRSSEESHICFSTACRMCSNHTLRNRLLLMFFLMFVHIKVWKNFFFTVAYITLITEPEKDNIEN